MSLFDLTHADYETLELVLVLDLPSTSDAWEKLERQAPPQWFDKLGREQYFQKRNAASGYDVSLSGLPLGSGQYRCDQLNDQALTKLVQIHLKETELEDSCALFGGVVLIADHQVVLVPQCCGTVADANYWFKLATLESGTLTSFRDEHPSPDFFVENDLIRMSCREDFEEYRPPAPLEFCFSRTQLNQACEVLRRAHAELAKKIDAIGRSFGWENAAHQLVIQHG